MTRSATAFLALLILPGMARAQQQQIPETHDVVKGETLWDLAQRYYQNPYQWPRIYQANRDVVEDPHWIYPGEHLVIPGVTGTATVSEVAVVPQASAPPAAPTPAAVQPSGEERTVFYDVGQSDAYLSAAAQASAPAVSRDIAYSARFLIPDGVAQPVLGQVGSLAGAEEERRRTYFTYDEVEVDTQEPLAAGTALQTYRIVGHIDGVGDVAAPTGVLSVTDRADNGVIAVVVNEFDRMTPGDLVRPLPEYGIRPGLRAQEVTSGPTATVVGFGTPQAVQGLFNIAFLDAGGAEGVSVGDEYVLMWDRKPGWPPTVEGRLQVVEVEPTHASARILTLRNPVFEPGVHVVLSRKMP